MQRSAPSRVHSLMAYHGSRASIEIPLNDAMGLRKANLGAGLYLSTDIDFAAKYGAVRKYEVCAHLLDHDTLTLQEREAINAYISSCIPPQRLAGYCEVQYRDFDLSIDSEKSNAIILYEDLFEKTASYYHDRAKVRMDPLPDNHIRIQWRDPGDILNEHPYRLWALFNEFGLDPVSQFGYEGVKCGHEISVRSHHFLKEISMINASTIDAPSKQMRLT